MIRKTISMPDNMGDWVKGRIHQGQYNNESEYFRDLVRRDQEEQNKLDFLQQRLAAGEADIEAGRFEDLKSDADIDRVFDTLDANETA